MGCCQSAAAAEAAEHGVGRRHVFLLGRRHCGKATLFQALGKSGGWAAKSASGADRESHTWNGLQLTKLSTNSPGGDFSFVERNIGQHVRDRGPEKCAVWYLVDAQNTHEVMDSRADIVRLCRSPDFVGVPLWLIINWPNAQPFSRPRKGQFDVDELADVLALNNAEELAMVRGRVARVVRIYLKRGQRFGAAAGATSSVGATSSSRLLKAGGGGAGGGGGDVRLELLQDAVAGGAATTLLRGTGE